MKNKWRILKIFVTVVIFGFLLSFSLKRFNDRKIDEQSIIVKLNDSSSPVYFVDEKDIRTIVERYNSTKKVGDVDIPSLEKKLNKLPAVDSANVYLNLNGKLNVDIKQRVPVFRLNNGGKGFYVDKKGIEFPISKTYSHPCMLVSGDVKKKEYKKLIELIEKINKDSFCKKFFVGITKENGNFNLATSDGNYKVEIGDLDRIDFKVKGFKTFVEKYLVYQAPEKYSKISVKYDNQIVTTLNSGYKPEEDSLQTNEQTPTNTVTGTQKPEEKQLIKKREQQYMETHDYSVGLDIGTTKIVAIVGRKNAHGKIEVLGVGKAKSLGVHKGIVNNISQTISSIKAAISEAEKSSGVPIHRVTVGIAGKHIRSLQHSDYIMRENPDKYITDEDIEILKDQVKKLVMLPGEEIIHVLPQEYKVDSEGEIQEPIGMHGKRLEANFHVVVGQMGSIRNIARCVREAGLEMEALTLEPLASSEAVLTTEEKEAGVAIVDIGGGTTDIAIFKDNIIRHTCVIPYGGGIITDDIKEGCSIIEKHAEQLKVKFGSAVPDLEKDSTFVTIPGLHGRPDKEISLKSLASIINARVEEILEMVNTELKAYGAYEQKRKLIAGIVLTGGGSNLKNLRQLANYVTGFDARIGFANEYIANDKNQYLKSPEFATSIGLLMESLKIHDKKPVEKPVEEPKIIEVPQTENTVEEVKTEEQEITQHIEEVKKNKPTFGQSILEKVKKFFEEVE